MENCIKIKGARVNNLKKIELEIPRDKLVVITGLSGSGKSSLAFDTQSGAWGEWSWSECTENETDCKQCDNSHREGEVTFTYCACGEGELKWHCGQDTGYEWTFAVIKACVLRPQVTESCPEPYEGTVVVTYDCYDGVWRISGKDHIDCKKKEEEAEKECTKLVESTTGFTNSSVCEQFAISLVPCSNYGVSAGAYISLSDSDFMCMVHNGCASGGGVSWLLSDGHTYQCVPGQITAIKDIRR